MAGSIFTQLVGQNQAVEVLERAIAAANSKSETQEMTHAWLFTGPPGSGRSNIAKAFASALVCKKGGCGQCLDCSTALAGTHPDVELVDVNGLSIKIDEIRDIVSRSAWGASTSNWRVVVIEDSDRMTDAAANALLKSLEEPGSSTIWLLCAPSLHDVLPTIRSRCRHINLKTPSKSEIARFLIENFDAKQEEAELVAQIAQGHIGKAKGLLRDKYYKDARNKVFQVLFKVKSEASAIKAAADLILIAQERVDTRFNTKNEEETEALKASLQGISRGLISGGAKSLKDLEKEQKARASRALKDELDGYLLDYLTFFRDCLAPSGPWINADITEEISRFHGRVSEAALKTLISKSSEVRELLMTNASQTLLLESFFLEFALQTRGL